MKKSNYCVMDRSQVVADSSLGTWWVVVVVVGGGYN